MVEIKEVDYGIANNFGDYIEINKNLKEDYPELYKQILEHELSHTDKKGFNAEDLMVDLGQKINTLQLIKFMARHPKSLYQFRPIYKQDGYWIYDINMILTWCLTFCLIALVVYAINWLL